LKPWPTIDRETQYSRKKSFGVQNILTYSTISKFLFKKIKKELKSVLYNKLHINCNLIVELGSKQQHLEQTSKLFSESF